ncbi:hypothetical protein ACFVHB_21660 [Kitasatospora sp. NPDC127111]|uniref:hypothetical protein n=1 Tax=Kitasatospora sp. NPDC127111 TaxID=3345363 RepID=UPI0036397B61
MGVPEHMYDSDLTLVPAPATTRPDESADHPAGEIRLRAGGGLGLRSHLLASGGSPAPSFEFPTMTVPA